MPAHIAMLTHPGRRITPGRRPYVVAGGRPHVATGLGRRLIVGRERHLTAILLFLLAAALAVGAYVLVANTSLASHTAERGVAGESAYTVSSQASYTFSDNGEAMTAVRFELDKAASDVVVALAAGTPARAGWTDCGASEATAPFDVICTFSRPIRDGKSLKLSVAAVSSGTVTTEQ
jgi:hypothetical protein